MSEESSETIRIVAGSNLPDQPILARQRPLEQFILLAANMHAQLARKGLQRHQQLMAKFARTCRRQMTMGGVARLSQGRHQRVLLGDCEPQARPDHARVALRNARLRGEACNRGENHRVLAAKTITQIIAKQGDFLIHRDNIGKLGIRRRGVGRQTTQSDDSLAKNLPMLGRSIGDERPHIERR